MTAVFCAPQGLKLVDSGVQTTAPASNLNIDEPGMVWRSSGLSNAYVIFQLSGEPFDTVAVVSHNLRSSDTVRVRLGSSLAEVNGAAPFSEQLPAWSGVAPLDRACTPLLLNAPVNYTFVRVDFSAPGLPAGYVEASRLVVGKRVINDGVDIGDEETFEDGSSVDEGLGYTTIDEYGRRIGRKITVSHIREADYYANWRPFLNRVGRSRAWLFMPTDDPTYLQQQIALVRITTSAKSIAQASDQNRIELAVLSVG